MEDNYLESKTEKYHFNRLKNFPISFLSIALGLIGFTLAWQKAEEILHIPVSATLILLYISIAVMVIISFIYLLKIIRYPGEVKSEFNNPIKINFYPILAKLFLITSIIFLSIDLIISKYLWWLGVIIQFVFTIVILSSWIRHERYEIHHINPAWFIPVVGCLIIPIAGVKHFSPDLSWFFLSIGLFWWLILTTLVINRMIFHRPIADKLVPTLFILFAPPFIGFIAMTKLLGGLNMGGNLLYYFGAFMFILIMFQFRMFSKLHFYLSWWAYSFPMSALTIATLLMYHETGSFFYQVASWILFVALNALIILLALKTAKAVKNRDICIEGED
jgi:tellurite resistance protein